MSFTRDWDKTLILDHSKFKSVPSFSRNLMDDLEERLGDILHGFTSGETIAGIKKGRFITVGTGAPSAGTGTGASVAIDLYCRTDGTGTAAELYALDKAGNEIKFTDGGKHVDTVNAKAGDFLSSAVTTARTGWTEVTATYTGRFMRVASSAALATGGSNTHSHSSTLAAPAHTHTNNLAVANESAHTHTLVATGPIASGGTSDYQSTTSAGSAHSHSLTGGVTGASATALTGSIADGDNVPAYFDVKLFQKS